MDADRASALASPSPLGRARADQVATLYASWPRTTASMLFGAALFCAAMWGQAPPALMAAWIALVVANQGWRALLVRAWRRAQPGASAIRRWGRYWSVGSTAAGALWGAAAIAMFPASPPHQALSIVCLFGVVLGGLNLTAVYKPSFYGFVLPALVPLIVRVGLEGGPVHLYTALVMAVVLAFVLAFGHRLNDVLTDALATRHRNTDLIAELKARTRAAVDARAAAEEANRGKSQLLAAASHDLRQPLHALGLFVAALGRSARDGELAPLVASVRAALVALEAQFAQLLDLSRLEAGALSPSRERVPLAPLFERLAREFGVEAGSRGLSLTFVRTRLAVDSDPLLLERMLRNLVSNALRYTRHGGVIVGARRRGANVAVEVVDSGVGIAPEHRERVFDEFFQVPGRADRPRAGGMGLGLAIVRRFAALVGARLTLESMPGHGSRFGIVAPRAADAPPPRIRRAPDGRTLAGACIAVIDDDPAAVEGMRALFSTWGAEIAGGAHADAVLAALGEVGRYPDLIVADLRLDDDASGLAAIARLRDELGVCVPALVVSGDLRAAAEREVRSAGFMLLAKPVVPASLEAAASTLVEAPGIAR
ncbi:two-component system, sensor histidine kinase [Burkholderiales bacterium]|nr:two-component system, sensor histidine kinase [Burkholderiales bacterium]